MSIAERITAEIAGKIAGSTDLLIRMDTGDKKVMLSTIVTTVLAQLGDPTDEMKIAGAEAWRKGQNMFGAVENGGGDYISAEYAWRAMLEKAREC